MFEQFFDVCNSAWIGGGEKLCQSVILEHERLEVYAVFDNNSAEENCAAFVIGVLTYAFCRTT